MLRIRLIAAHLTNAHRPPSVIRDRVHAFVGEHCQLCEENTDPQVRALLSRLNVEAYGSGTMSDYVPFVGIPGGAAARQGLLFG